MPPKLPKLHHHLETKCSNAGAYRRRSPSNLHSTFHIPLFEGYECSVHPLNWRISFSFTLYIQLLQGDDLSHRLNLFQTQVLTPSSNGDVGRVWRWGRVRRKGFSHRSSMTSNPSNKLEIGIPDYSIYFSNDTRLRRWRDLISHCSTKSKFPPLYLQRVVKWAIDKRRHEKQRGA